MEQHRNKPHVGQLFIMAHALAALTRHEVAAEEAELGRGILRLQTVHQPRGMKVARGLAYDEVVLHKPILLSSSRKS